MGPGLASEGHNSIEKLIGTITNNIFFQKSKENNENDIEAW